MPAPRSINGIIHPLPVGTRVYYEDFDGGTGTIVLNDNTTPEFAAAVDQWNARMEASYARHSTGHTFPLTSPAEVDYVIQFDDFDDPLPVQAGGILRILSSEAQS